MKKRVIGLFLLIAVIVSMSTPAFAMNKTAELFEYYDTCSFEDGSILEASILDNGNLLISLSKDNILLESTEIDYTRRVLLFTDASNDSKTHYIKEIPFSSYMEYNSLGNEDLSTLANGTYTQFGKVSFRGQIGTDYFSTPKADVYVRHNAPGDKVLQTVHVSNVSSVTTLVSIVVSALAIVRPEITAIKSFLITLGLIVADGSISTTIDNIELEAIRYGENIKAVYNGKSHEYTEGARIKASGNIKVNGKHANQVFYDGLCEKHVRDAKIEFCSDIYSTFFRGYGTLRGMTFSEK